MTTSNLSDGIRIGNETYTTFDTTCEAPVSIYPVCQSSECLKPLEKVMACSGCLSVTYCSSVCIKKDWTEHRQFCQKTARKISAGGLRHLFSRLWTPNQVQAWNTGVPKGAPRCYHIMVDGHRVFARVKMEETFDALQGLRETTSKLASLARRLGGTVEGGPRGYNEAFLTALKRGFTVLKTKKQSNLTLLCMTPFPQQQREVLGLHSVSIVGIGSDSSK